MSNENVFVPNRRAARVRTLCGRAAPFVLLAGLACWLFWPLLLGGRVLYFGDIGLYFAPLLDFQRRTLLDGRVPLWNPHLWCGTPFWGNPQAWPLYPSSALLYLFPAEKAVGMVGAGHCLWAAWGTFAFLRRVGRGTWASLLGALCWGFGGHLVSKMQFPNMTQAASFLPWLLWALEGVALTATVRRSATLAVFVGLSLLAAHPQMFLMQFYTGVAYLVWRLLSLPKPKRGRVLLLTSGAFLLGIGLAMGYLLPVAEMARESVRVRLSLAAANRFILPPYALTNFVLPNFFGNPQTEMPFVARGNFWEAACYAGIVPFVLAVCAVVFGLRRADVWFWAGAATVSVWLSLGRDAFLYTVAFYTLPGVSKFHDAARWLHIGTFALAYLAACGMDGLFTGWKQAQWVVGAFLLAATAGDLLPFSSALNPTMPASVYQAARTRPQNDTNARTWYADESRAWERFVSYRSYDNVNTPNQAAAFFASQMPNVFVFESGRDAAGYEPVHRADMDALVQALRRDKEESPLLPVLGVQAVVCGRGRDLHPIKAPILPQRGRAQLWQTWRAAQNHDEALARVTQPDFDGVPFVEGVKEQNSATFPQTLSIVEPTPERVFIPLPPKHGGGLLVLADALHPGWQARVDGKNAPVLRVNGALRGVRVLPDTKTVEFHYEPDSVRLGLFVSLAAVGILSAVFVASLAAERAISVFPARGTVATLETNTTGKHPARSGTNGRPFD